MPRRLPVRSLLVAALLTVTAAPGAAQDAEADPDAFFARRGDLALTAGVFGPGGGGISSIGARYWVSDAVALGLEVGEAGLDVDEWDDAGNLFPSYLTTVHTQSASVWGEHHRDLPVRWASLLVGARAYAGVQSRDSFHSWLTVECESEPCALGGYQTSAREEAVTGGLAALYGVELRVFRGLTVGLTSELGLARTSAELRQRTTRGTPPPDAERSEWHTVQEGRLFVSVYL